MTERYQSVNGAWPDGTNDGRDIAPTPQEALTAAKRLYRLVMGKPFQGPVKAVTGNRRTWVRYRVLNVNPDLGSSRRPINAHMGGKVLGEGSGWHGLVHDLSHYCHRRLHPGHKPHGGEGTHAWIERTMIEHVVKSGWLDGKLKRPEKPTKQTDVREERRARVLKRLAAWEAKRKRAERALAKLRRQARYYARALQA
jgi:hypothetical protein